MVDLNYGGVMKKRKKVLDITFKNPALRMMKWKLSVEPKMKDIFEVLDPASVSNYLFKKWWFESVT